MSENPLLSFVVPVYKKKPGTLRRCLQSLFGGSYKNIEVICSFDGGDAELEEVAREFPVKSVVIEHGGAPKARNTGYTFTQGRYVSFWDADCFAKPEMAKMWIETFKEHPEVDFVYSGYEFEDGTGLSGEPFDLHLLECGNYIATMFPMKREIFPGFDESLEGAQDWDMWLTLAKKGYKGHWNEGSAFITESPDKDSISGKAWNEFNYRKTVQRIKEKHGIPLRDWVIGSAMEKFKGLHMAKLLDADFIQFPSWRPHQYKLVFNLGFGEDMRFRNAPPNAVKVQYWLNWDADSLERIPYKSALMTIESAQKEITVNLCNDIVCKKRLKQLGLEAEILALPSDISDLETKLPEEFRVVLDIDPVYSPFFKGIENDLPYIKIDRHIYTTDITKYSVLVSFNPVPAINEGLRKFLVNGRHVISNVQAPYCGNMDLEVSYASFKDALIERIRELRNKPFNKDAQDYYKQRIDPQLFKRRLAELFKEHYKEIQVPMEVL